MEQERFTYSDSAMHRWRHFVAGYPCPSGKQGGYRQICPSKVLLASLFCLAASCGPPPEKLGPPERRYCRREGLQVRTVDGSGVVGVLHYRDEVEVRCGPTNCMGEVDGKAFKIGQIYLVVKVPPVQTQYVRHRVTEKEVPVLEANQEVAVVEWDPKRARVRLKEPRIWVATANLQDHPETSDERTRRLKSEKKAAEIARRLAEANRLAMIENRRAYADRLRTHFLDEGMDIRVRVSGTRADRLTMEYILFNAVWVHNFQKGSLIDEIKLLGFRRVDMRNGSETWYWTF